MLRHRRENRPRVYFSLLSYFLSRFTQIRQTSILEKHGSQLHVFSFFIVSQGLFLAFFKYEVQTFWYHVLDPDWHVFGCEVVWSEQFVCEIVANYVLLHKGVFVVFFEMVKVKLVSFIMFKLDYLLLHPDLLLLKLFPLILENFLFGVETLNINLSLTKSCIYFLYFWILFSYKQHYFLFFFIN